MKLPNKNKYSWIEKFNEFVKLTILGGFLLSILINTIVNEKVFKIVFSVFFLIPLMLLFIVNFVYYTWIKLRKPGQLKKSCWSVTKFLGWLFLVTINTFLSIWLYGFANSIDRKAPLNLEIILSFVFFIIIAIPIIKLWEYLLEKFFDNLN